MDRVNKGIQDRTQPLPTSDHSIPADPVNSIRDIKSEEMQTSSPSLTMPIATTSTTTTTSGLNTVFDTRTLKTDQILVHSTSPKYASPPVGSGGKYMLKSKRASWIDASACDISEASPLSLPERLMAKQRKTPISDIGKKQQGQQDQQHKPYTSKEPTSSLSSSPVIVASSPTKNSSDINALHKSGAPSAWLRGSRRTSLDQHATTSPSTLYSSSASSLSSYPADYSTKIPVLPKHRQKALHITTATDSESSNRHRTSSISSIMTDSSTLQDDDDSSPCSSSTSYQPTTSVSPMFINQDKGKSAFLHDHSPGSSSPLSCEISSSSSLRNNSKRRSSMTLLKNIPSSELSNIINGYTGSSHGDITGSPTTDDALHIKQSSRINTATTGIQTGIQASLSSTSSLSSSPSIPYRSGSVPSPQMSNNNGIPAYQHSLLSFFKRQLSAPKANNAYNNENGANDRDVDAFDLYNEPSAGQPTHHDRDDHLHSSTVYPALLLDGLGQDTKVNGLSSSRKPSLYINTKGVLHGSAPNLCHWDDAMDYFALPVEMGKGLESPLSAPGNRFLPLDDYEQHLYCSRLRKINKWCHISWNDSKTSVKIFLRHGSNNRKQLKLLIEVPASDVYQGGVDLVNCIPWTNWMDEYQKVNDKPFKVPFWTCNGGDTVPSRTSTLSDINAYTYGSKPMTREQPQLAAGRQQHNLSLDLKSISNGIGYNGDYHQYPLDSSDQIMTPISADDSSVLSLRRISTSSSYLAGRQSSGFAPCDNLGSVGYCYHDTGNRMGAFGRLGTILSGGGMDEKSQHASSSSSSTVRVRHTIKTRLQSAKNACNDEIRIITDGLNKYVERGLRYVECLGEDLEQEGPSDESDDHDDSCYNGLHGYSNTLSEDKNDGIIDFMAHGSNNYGYHPLQSATDIGKASVLGFCASPGIEPPPLSSPSSSSSSSLPTANSISNSNIPARRRSIAIRLQNIEEQTELSSSETDQSQVTTPSDERLPKQTMIKLSAQQTTTNQSMIASSLNALVPQDPSADLSSQSSTQIPSRYTMISEDAYLPTPFILALQDMITLAQTVLDTPLENYLENVGGCAAIVSAIQSVGKQWDVHPDWPCREWYVRLLLCVAALNRVLEWWEAERGFWCSWNTSFGVNGSFIGMNNTATNNVTLTAKLQPVNATKPALNCNDSETDDNIDELDFIHGVRYRSISETESAWSYMESQDDGALLRNDCLPSTTMDYSDNNSIGGDYGQHLIGGDNRTMTGSTLLQEAVQRGQCNTIVLELTLVTTVVQYLSPVWKQLIGSDSQEVIGKNISDLLLPADRHVFSTATTDLVQDTSRTVELRFSIQPSDATVIEMEGKGMIMYNRVTGQPSHTMWVIKPLSHNPTVSNISPSSTTNKQLSEYSQIPIHDSTLLTEDLIGNGHSLHLQTPDGNNAKDTWATKYDGNMEHYAQLRMRSISEPITAATKDLPSESSQLDMIVSEKLGTNISWSPPSATMRRAISHGGGSAYANNRLLSPTALMSLPPALCRVCERWVVATFFEQHSELCVELHRTEMDVIICNDNLCDLRQVALELLNKYQSTLKMEGINADEVNNGDGIVKTDHIGPGSSMDPDHGVNSIDDLEGQKSNTVAMFEELLYILEVAISIPTPNNEVEDGRAGFGINMKTDGDSDDEILATLKSKMVQIIYWRSPVIEDASFMTLVHEVEHQTKEKVEVVNRMRDRLEYNGRVRLDFQQSTQQDKGWTEYVDDKNSNQLATSTMNPNDSSKSFDSENLCNQNDETGNQPKKNFFGKCKHWKSKSASGMTRMARMTKTRRQKRKARTTKAQPQIMEMETIDTPLASPGLSFETHSKLDSLQISDNNQTKQQHQPLIPSSAISTTSSSTNVSIHRSLPPTIKDYDIIKPISKGAFGSVFLAKKRLTGDYYAIKFLKKSDMIAKNQVTNVKAERMILMTQTDSPFVTKLYYTFQSKDYLYLVLEYLNGGDCSALIKALGRLPEEWARNYLAEVTLGLAYLYEKNIIHRDLKPDNLLIDQNGHLKLTDFGLSRIGFLDRRVRDELSLGSHSDTNAPLSSSPAPSRSNTPPSTSSFAPSNSTLSPTLSNLYKHSYFSALFEKDRQRRGSQASSSASICTLNEYSPRLQQQQQYEQIPSSQNRHPYHHITSCSSSAASTPGWVDERSSFNWHRSSNGGSQVGKSTLLLLGKSANSNNIEKNDNEFADTEHRTRKDFRAIGTPDYIAPESILGTGHDAMVDWWALGIICYEFFYGYPPFNDESPDKVFENILSRRIDWHENSVSVSEEARDFMEKLMTLDPSKRLGANGPEEVKQHPFFKNINWDNLLTESPSFVPQPVSEEDTTYFDARGATMQEHGLLDKDLLETKERTEVEHAKNIIMEQNPAKVTSLYRTGNNASHGTPDSDGENKLVFGAGLEQDDSEFGAFVYKNLPLLEKANENAIRKLRHDSIAINAASPVSASSIESLSSTPRTGGPGDGGHAPTTNWFHNSLPAISRKKRNSIFDFTSGSNGVHRPSISTSSSPSSLNYLTYTTSLPTTPSNLSPSSSSKVISASPSCIPIVPSRNINTNVNKDNKGKFALSKPSSNTSSTVPRHRSVSSPGNRLLHMATGQITSSFAKIMKDGKLADEVGNDGLKPSTSIDHGSQQNDTSTTQINEHKHQLSSKSRHQQQQQQQHPITIIENTTSSTTCSSFVDFNSRGKSARILDCLLADDNPISCKILETILDRLHCRCVIVRNGAQAIRYAMGDVQFDLIFMDIRMPIIDGEAAARMIKSVKNRNQNTPIIAVTAYERTLQLADTFDDIVNKPITREIVQRRINFFCQNLDIDGSNVSSPLHHCHRPLAESSSTSNPSTAILYTTQPIPIPPPY